MEDGESQGRPTARLVRFRLDYRIRPLIARFELASGAARAPRRGGGRDYAHGLRDKTPRNLELKMFAIFGFPILKTLYET